MRPKPQSKPRNQEHGIMVVSFTGLVAHRNPADFELRAATGTFDVDYLKAFAVAHEEAGFDRVLIGYGSTSPDGLHLGTYVTSVTERLGVMLAHRPGFVAPTLAARTLATIDQLSREGVRPYHLGRR